MYCFLKLILIVFFFYCQRSSGYQVVDPAGASSDINSIIMLCIGSCILVAMLVLMGVVIGLYIKVTRALKVPNVPVCFTLNNDPAMVAQDKVTAATSITAASCPNLGCCDDCNLYANFEALPPCYCNVNEGL
ncbi:protein FAM24A-like [Pteropus vampyrus]|uniref:Protein FAM24A-like n=1 Tax=Pteropus vampyrus TaxID=132908 RepID=A0A6P3REQ2_PTEVA|nr:protein FAM24A-like [Pteropus vampyrus]